MKPAAFDYVRADSPDEVAHHLAQFGDEARILAGGQSLIPILNMRLAQPSVLVDLSRSREMVEVQRKESALEIDAAVTQGAVQERAGLMDEVPLLAMALPWISHFQIRNRGTVCGSLAHADPSAELPLVLCALNGEVELVSKKGSRHVLASDFFTGMLTTCRRPDEFLRRARFPRAKAGQAFDFREFGLRHGDFAACAVAVVATRDRIRVAVGGVADKPAIREWPLLTGTGLDDALNDLAWGLNARSDSQVSAAMRRHLVRRLGRQAVDAALQRLEFA
jgi:2-furoyl-CoA dehydrogenase FAD binding subunit